MNIRLYGVFIVMLVVAGINACSSNSSKLLEGKDTALFTVASSWLMSPWLSIAIQTGQYKWM